MTNEQLLHHRNVEHLTWDAIAALMGASSRRVARYRYEQAQKNLERSGNPEPDVRRKRRLCLGCQPQHYFNSPHAGVRMCKRARARVAGMSPMEPDDSTQDVDEAIAAAAHEHL